MNAEAGGDPWDGQDEGRRLTARRGARFEEALWERSPDEQTDEEWLAGLRKDLGDGSPWGDGSDARVHRPAGMDAHAGLGVSSDILAEVRRALEEVARRLGGLESDVARVRAALVRTQTLLDRAQMAAGDVSPARPAVTGAVTSDEDAGCK